MWWYLLIKNSVVIICFTLLAIHFDKWWIVLFSVLFITFVEIKNKASQKEEEPHEHSKPSEQSPSHKWGWPFDS